MSGRHWKLRNSGTDGWERSWTTLGLIRRPAYGNVPPGVPSRRKCHHRHHGLSRRRLTRERCLKHYGHRGVNHLLSVPVLAAYNKHQVRFVIHYLVTDPQLPQPWIELQAALRTVADTFGHAADLYMAEMCQRAGRRTALALDKPERLGM